MGKIAVIIPAAGQGVRFGASLPKQFLEVKGKSLLFWTIKAISQFPSIDEYIVVLPPKDFELYQQMVSFWALELKIKNPLKITPGGRERQESVWNGLKMVSKDIEWVAIHDGARPLVSTSLIERVINKAKTLGAAIPAIPVRDTVKRVNSENSTVEKTVDRKTLWLAQTPQVFKKDIILKAYEHALSSGFIGTDDASLVENISHPVALVEGDPINIKITTREDMEWLIWRMERARYP